MKTRILRIAAVLLASMLVLAGLTGATAWFDDTETSTGNYLEAGTLDLMVDGKDDPVVEHVVLSNIAPGWSERYTWTLKNTGTTTGDLTVEFGDITNRENGRNEAERADDTTGNGYPGELGVYLMTKVHLEAPPSGGVTVSPLPLDTWSGGFFRTPKGVVSFPLVSNGEAVFWMDLELPTGTNNIVQSDSVEFDITFHLDQVQPYLPETTGGKS